MLAIEQTVVPLLLVYAVDIHHFATGQGYFRSAPRLERSGLIVCTNFGIGTDGSGEWAAQSQRALLGR
jgi:hypothetical protein